MAEPDFAALLQSHGWYLAMIRKYKTRYAYAKRREGKKVVTKYLRTEKKLRELTIESVVEMLARPAKTRARSVSLASSDQAQTDHQNGRDRSYRGMTTIRTKLGHLTEHSRYLCAIAPNRALYVPNSRSGAKIRL